MAYLNKYICNIIDVTTLYIYIYIYIYMGDVLEKRTIHHFHSFSALHGYRVKTCIPI